MDGCWRKSETAAKERNLEFGSRRRPIATCNMSNKKLQVRVYADSRGRLLKSELYRLNDGTIHFHTRYRKGAQLVNLWEMAELDLLSGQIDLVILLGGICNITDAYYDHHGRRSFWPPNNITQRFDDIKGLMRDMASNYRLLNTKTKLCFIPEAGIDLVKFNSLKEPISIEVRRLQSDLETELQELRDFTKNLNTSMNVLTPWTLKVTHRRHSNKWIPVYSRSNDGLHPTLHQAYQIASVLHKFVITLFQMQDIYQNKR